MRSFRAVDKMRIIKDTSTRYRSKNQLEKQHDQPEGAPRSAHPVYMYSLLIRLQSKTCILLYHSTKPTLKTADTCGSIEGESLKHQDAWCGGRVSQPIV